MGGVYLLDSGGSQQLKMKREYEILGTMRVVREIFGDLFLHCDGYAYHRAYKVLMQIFEEKQFARSMQIEAFKRYYGLVGREAQRHSLQSAGKYMNVSTERCRQVFAKILRKLRHPNCSRPIREALEADVVFMGKHAEGDFEWFWVTVGPRPSYANFYQKHLAIRKNPVTASKVMAEVLARSVDCLDLSARVANGLDYVGIDLVGELVCKTRKELLNIKNLGRKSVNEIEDVLAQMDLDLATEDTQVVRSDKLVKYLREKGDLSTTAS